MKFYHNNFTPPWSVCVSERKLCATRGRAFQSTVYPFYIFSWPYFFLRLYPYIFAFLSSIYSLLEFTQYQYKTAYVFVVAKRRLW